MENAIQEIKDQAFNLLSYRDRSCYELKERLLKKGFEKDDVDLVIERLKDLGYLNDEEFAYKWVKYRLKNKPRGKILLKKELFSKGINERLIDEVIDKLIDDQMEIDLGTSIAKKWLKSHQKDIDKLKRYLYYKGFSANIIYSIINKLGINKDCD